MNLKQLAMIMHCYWYDPDKYSIIVQEVVVVQKRIFLCFSLKESRNEIKSSKPQNRKSIKMTRSLQHMINLIIDGALNK